MWEKSREMIADLIRGTISWWQSPVPPGMNSPQMNDATANQQTPKQVRSGNSGRWFLAGLGLVLACMGALFVWLLGRSFLRAYEMRSWPEVPCVILSSEVAERIHDPQSSPEYRHEVSFGYQWKEHAFTGDHLTLRGSPWSSQQEEVMKKAAEYPVRANMTCHIDPAHPEFAVLKTESLAPGYSIWFPGLFVVGGLGIALRALFPARQP